MVVEIQVEGNTISRHFESDASAIQFAAVLLSKSTRVIGEHFYQYGEYIDSNGSLNVRVARSPRWGT